MLRTLPWLTLVALLAAGCGGSRTAAGPPKAPVDPWVLACVDKAAKSPALVTNGLIGLRLGRDGSGVGPMFSSDAFQPARDGEEKILALANPLALQWMEIDGEPPMWSDADTYRQSLDMRDGVLTTRWDQRGIGFECQTALHPDLRVVAQRWRFTGSNGRVVRWSYPTLKGDVPKTLRVVNAIGGKTNTSPQGTYLAGPSKGKPVVFERVASLERGGELPTFEAVRAAATRKWKERWKTDIVIEGPVEDQQAVRSWLYYLRASVHPKAGRAPGPMALSSDRYFGHVFWDADVWVFPALCLLDPDAARTIPAYRLAMARAARANYDHWIVSGRPTADGMMGGRTPEMPRWDGILYPWESSVSGRETVPGPSRFQHHITGSVAWGLGLAAELELADAKAVARVRREAAAYYLNRITRRRDGLYSLQSTMSPDENHIGDDDLYTNVLAQQLIDEALSQVPKARRPTLLRPKDSVSLLNYAGDTVRGYKQAAGVLAAFPLQDPGAEKQAVAMVERFAPLVTKNGPAMSDSVHAVLWARAGKREEAYAAWRRSWVDRTRHPLLLFSEKRSLDATYFTTGAAGSLQTVLYGFLGFRIDSGQEHPSDWSKLLSGKARLTVKPQLPPSWKRVTLKGFTVLGQRYTLTATHDAVHVTEGDHD